MLRKVRAGFRRPQLVWKTNDEAGGSIRVLSPLSIPLPKLAFARRFNGFLYQAAMRFWAKSGGMSNPVLLNYVPVLAHAMAGWGKRTGGDCIYHCVDRWDAFGMYDSAVMAEMDEACCRYADRVIASSRDLGMRCERFSDRVSVVMHGVDYEHFADALKASNMAARPEDLPVGPVIGFFGLVSEWVDQDLIVTLAREIPDAQIVLIGAADVSVDRLEAVSNIHILGPRPFQELPRYIAHFSVGIIPFVINDLTHAVNPIKLREMLAGGCPVVSTPLPEVSALADSTLGVSVCNENSCFVEACRERVQVPVKPEQRAAISSIMRNETWCDKVDEMKL
jgi:glycosyltransferase involved in cell wall biosynthesis